jgi:hypothetical protein
MRSSTETSALYNGSNPLTRHLMNAPNFPTLALITREGVLEEVLVHGNIKVTSVNYGGAGSDDQPIVLANNEGQAEPGVVNSNIQKPHTDQIALLASVLPPLGRVVFNDLKEEVRAFVIIRNGIFQTVLTDEPIGLIEVDREPASVAPQDECQTIALAGSTHRSLVDWSSVEVNVAAVDKMIESIDRAEPATTAPTRAHGPR